MSLSGIEHKIEQQIIQKFRKAGAISNEKAVTIEKADLDLQEQYWLDYFAGSFLGSIKKTKDNRYYL
ncbi:MAG: hypothetical protein ABIH76_05880 [Candidatus Bathyarchaeota archaeon]